MKTICQRLQCLNFKYFSAMNVPRIKKMVRTAMTFCRINIIARKKISHLPRMIMYHGFCKTGSKDLRRMPIDQFRKQLIYIKKNYSTFKVSELILAIKSKG